MRPSARSATSISTGLTSVRYPSRRTSCAATLEVIKGEMLGLSSLTTAELRLLPLLPSHLSLAEIGQRLFVSRNTVKTQAISVYRKLGVSTRSETIDRMHELGLIVEA